MIAQAPSVVVVLYLVLVDLVATFVAVAVAVLLPLFYVQRELNKIVLTGLVCRSYGVKTRTMCSQIIFRDSLDNLKCFFRDLVPPADKIIV